MGRPHVDRALAELKFPSVKSVAMQGDLAEGSTFRWKAGPGTITSTIQQKGLVVRLFRGLLQKTLDSALDDGLRYLKAEAERRSTA